MLPTTVQAFADASIPPVRSSSTSHGIGLSEPVSALVSELRTVVRASHPLVNSGMFGRWFLGARLCMAVLDVLGRGSKTLAFEKRRGAASNPSWRTKPRSLGGDECAA